MLLLAAWFALGIGPLAPWKVEDHLGLNWDGEIYAPIGVRLPGRAEAIRRVKALGVEDVVVELPADGTGWREAIEALEAESMRYLIAIVSPAPPALGVAVEPAGYRVPNLVRPTPLELPLPDADHALAVLALQRDGTVQWHRRVTVRDDRLALDVDPPVAMEHVLLVYPHMRHRRMPDYWEGFDLHRDQLLAALRSAPLGPGFRGLINPLGEMVNFPPPESSFVPTSPLFRLELEAFLRRRYTSPETARRSWALRASEETTFAELARLVPLWTATRGVPLLWDPETDRLHPVDQARSTAWRDIQETILATSLRRYERLLQALRSVISAPVIQEWRGWSGPYETGESGLDGIGMRLTGTSGSEVIESGCRAASSALRAGRPVWLVATSITLPEGESFATDLSKAIQDSESMGARAWFVEAREEEHVREVARLADRRASESSFVRPSPLFYPEVAMNPAAPMRLPGGRWWLPSPASGNRIDFGPDYAVYRLSAGNESYAVLWSLGEPRRTRLRVSDTKGLTIKATDGSDLRPRIGRNTIDLTLPTTPVVFRGLDEVPAPEDSRVRVRQEFEELVKAVERNMINLAEERLLFADNLQAFERNPGASLALLWGQVDRLNIEFGLFTWIEAERPASHTFSEVYADPGCSGGSALRLRTRLPSPPEGFVARYRFPTRAEATYEIWIAARIPPDLRDRVSVQIGDRSWRPQRGPVSLYGLDFGWYFFGSTSFIAGAEEEIRVHVDSTAGADLALDAILLSPGPFRPNGLAVPRALDLRPTPGGPSTGTSRPGL